MKKYAFAALALLLMGFSLPRQDVKTHMSQLPSGATMFTACEAMPFDRIGVQFVVHYENNQQQSAKSEVENAIQNSLQQGGFSSVVHVKPLERSPANSTIFALEIPKKRPPVIESVFREISARINSALAAQNREVIEKYFAPKNVYVFVMGGFKKQLFTNSFSNLLLPSETFSAVSVEGDSSYIALSYPTAEPKYLSIFDALLKQRTSEGMMQKCASFECSARLEKLLLETESMRRFGVDKQEMASIGAGNERENFLQWMREELTYPFVEVGISKNDPYLLSELQESREWLTRSGLLPLCLRSSCNPIALCSSSDPFYSLPISKSQGDKIHTIIRALGNDSVIKLLWRKSELERLGDDIDSVHPLAFLWYIFKRPELASCVRSFRGSYFKWGNFIDGCKKNFKIMAKRNQLDQYIPEFCRELGLDCDEAMRKVRTKDWDGLVEMLL